VCDLDKTTMSLATVSATWRRQVHPFSLTAAASTNAIMLNTGGKVVIVLVKRDFTLPPLNSAKIATCLVVSRLYEITAKL